MAWAEWGCIVTQVEGAVSAVLERWDGCTIAHGVCQS